MSLYTSALCNLQLLRRSLTGLLIAPYNAYQDCVAQAQVRVASHTISAVHQQSCWFQPRLLVEPTLSRAHYCLDTRSAGLTYKQRSNALCVSPAIQLS